MSPYQEVNGNQTLFIGDLSMRTGVTIYATAIVYNSVRLRTMLSSSGVVVSPDPHLIVLDGNGEDDIDFQTDLSIIQGMTAILSMIMFIFIEQLNHCSKTEKR